MTCDTTLYILAHFGIAHIYVEESSEMDRSLVEPGRGPQNHQKPDGTIRSGKLLVNFSFLCPIVSSDLHPSNSETPYPRWWFIDFPPSYFFQEVEGKWNK